MSETLERSLRSKAQAKCEFDEFRHDILTNQILNATLRLLIMTRDIDQDLRQDLRTLSRRFQEVSDIRIELNHFRQVHIHRNNLFYEFLMRICELIHQSILPESDKRGARFSDILHDEMRMGDVFENFVRNFLRAEQTTYTVKRDEIAWDAEAPAEEDARRLPKMITDITLRSPDKTIVIDTKFYKETLQKGYRGNTKKVRSSHLYQLYSYLRNMESRTGPDATAEGMLLYPTVDEEVDLAYDVQGHRIYVKTINLAQDWQGIREDLLGLIG